MSPVVCGHGREGFCHDEASPEERETFEVLHRHAYEWALFVGLDRDVAEAYAGAYAAENYAHGVEEAPRHERAFEAWRAA